MNNKDYYKTLGIDRNATQDEVKNVKEISGKLMANISTKQNAKEAK